MFIMSEYPKSTSRSSNAGMGCTSGNRKLSGTGQTSDGLYYHPLVGASVFKDFCIPRSCGQAPTLLRDGMTRIMKKKFLSVSHQIHS